ncbi:MAG: YfjI family protein, partial [Halothiobacillus sp.]|nr:YfjI family protein [Halothiobacillus sp.]
LSPTSLYLLTIAESGERKTSVDAYFTKPIRDFEAVQAGKYGAAAVQFKADLQAWDAERKAILRLVEKNIALGLPNEYLRVRLTNHLLQEPQRPKCPKLIYNDVTPAALKFGLSESWPSAGIISDEAGSVFNGLALSEPGLFNSLWGGSDITVDRRSSGSFTVRDPRLTISLMLQPGIFGQYMGRKGKEFRDIGFLARFLVAYPISTQGTRLNNHREPPSWDNLERFQGRLTQILNEFVNEESVTPHTQTLLHFSNGAKVLWVEMYNDLELLVRPGALFVSIKDFAAKTAESLARLAGLFHYFEGETGDISANTMQCAVEVIRWYANEFYRLFGMKPEVSQIELDAQILAAWLWTKYWSIGTIWQYKTKIRQNCPNVLRRDGRFKAALDLLASTGRIWIRDEPPGISGKKPSLIVCRQSPVQSALFNNSLIANRSIAGSRGF